MSDKKWTDNKNMADNIDMKNRKNGEEMKDPQDRLKVQEMEDERIEKQGQVLLNKNREKHRIHLLSIIGEIEGHEVSSPQTKTTKYEHVLPQLAAIEDSDEIDGILVLLNTVGGDVEAGLAIAELIAGMKKPTVSLVLGGGHSIGVPLAVSAQYSFIVPTATMTIHPVRMNGLVLGVPQTLSYFEKMQERIVSFVTENSHIPAERFEKLMMQTGQLMMDVGTSIDGTQAVEEGLIDGLGGLSDAIEKLYELIEKNRETALDTSEKEGGTA